MNIKDWEKAIRVRIEKIRSIEDPLEAYVFFYRHFKYDPDRTVLSVLKGVWESYPDWKDDIDRLEKGRQEFLKIMKPIIDKLEKQKNTEWKAKITEKYSEIFGEFE